RVRDAIRDRFPSELRAALLGGSTEPGFEFSRIEKRIADRLTEVITERLASAVYERSTTPVREWLGEATREAVSGTPLFNDVERVTSRIRERIEPQATSALTELVRERLRETIRDQIQQVLRERLGEVFQVSLGQPNGGPIEPERVIELAREKLVEP